MNNIGFETETFTLYKNMVTGKFQYMDSKQEPIGPIHDNESAAMEWVNKGGLLAASREKLDRTFTFTQRQFLKFNT